MESEPNFKTLSKPAYSLGFQNSKHIDFFYIYSTKEFHICQVTSSCEQPRVVQLEVGGVKI
jgi:hypothetical protein